MPCSGCGGKGHTPGPSHGHILGCGASEFNEVPRYSPFTKVEQEKLLHQAMTGALETSKRKNIKPDEPAFATELAESLAKVLQVNCKE